jgi:ABC-type transport system substrate-binding protein
MKLTTQRILILAPLLISLFLLQSYFWVPTYEDETKGNPQRLNEFITASIGDAAILNPVLSSDSASGDIEALVFEGLLDRDQNLHLRGRLATSWDIFEEAYFYINQSAEIPGLKKASDEEVLTYLEKAKAGDLAVGSKLRASLDNITKIALIPPKQYVVTQSVKGKEKETIEIHVNAPTRIKLTLKTVDQDLFENLSLLLGQKYFLSFPSADYLSLEQTGHERSKSTAGNDKTTLRAYAKDILPATEHNPVIVFHLRPDIKFHDGHVFSARDVKFTYDAVMNPENLSPRLADYEPVKAVEIIDPLTVRIFYKYLYSPAIGTWTIGILPAHLLDRAALRNEAVRRGRNPEKFTMRDSEFNRHPIGCGPFVFKDWESDQYILLDRFEDYWGGEPNYHRYYYRIIPDPLTQEMEFYSGTLDTYNVQPHQVKRLEEEPEYQHFSGLSFGYTYIGYNMRRHPFDDRRVRLALGMAIDVDKIIRYVLYGQGERITGPFAEQTDYYDRNIKPVLYDPEGALRLLKEAGWNRNSEGWLEKNGKRLQFTLITNSGNDIRKSIMAIVQNEWRQIGIDVHTDLLEWSVFIQERVNKLDFDALILGWQMGVEPDLYQIWYSTQTHPYQLNFVGFENHRADELIIKIRQEYNHERQVEYCHQLHKIIAYEQPYTFLYVGRWTAILDKRIVIKEVEASGKVIYKKITPTKTGNYTFYFNKWIKLPEVPSFAPEG